MVRVIVAGLIPLLTLVVGGAVDTRTTPEPEARAAVAAPCAPAPLEQRAGLPLLVGLGSAAAASDPSVVEVLDAGVGGVLLTPGTVRSPQQVADLVAGLRAGAGRPLVVATGDESGRVSTFRGVLGATPSARTLAAGDVDDVRSEARRIGTALAGLGVDLVLAPVVDLDGGPAGAVIGDRSFSADPDVAGRYGRAWAEGLADAGLHPTAKHFPGHGRTQVDSHVTLPQVTVGMQELRREDLAPFAALIDSGVPAVMVGHLAYSAVDASLPASMAPRAYALLRDMGFEGVAMTDSLVMGAVSRQFAAPEAAVRAVAAGADAVLTEEGGSARALRDALATAVRDGRLAEDRLDQAATRMIALAGGDPRPVTCRAARLPRMEVAPASGAAEGASRRAPRR